MADRASGRAGGAAYNRPPRTAVCPTDHCAQYAPPELSVVVITKNEARRLGACLRSVAFADEVVVVDSGSTDGTPALARESAPG